MISRSLDWSQPVGDPLRRALYLTGPTASGKTAIGIELALELDAEIVALDSMTLYRGMDIGTAKPNLAERRGVPHHLIDVLDPWEAASVADFRAWAIEAVLSIEARNHRALFVGGTALYLKALLRGLFEGPSAVPEIRERLEAEAEQNGNLALHARLASVDPITAARLHPNDRRRVIRALEVLESTGVPLSAHQNEHERPAPPGVHVFAIDRPRPELHERIDRRVEEMFAQGLVEEVERLESGEKPLGDVPAQGVGYLETRLFLRGEISRLEAIRRTQARTRQFAKRQCTWFRGLEEVRLWPVSGALSAREIATNLIQEIRTS